ncbi:regulator of Vps4 activity in the MVB pathway-domain-containing protein [Aspergillus floccosus]
MPPSPQTAKLTSTLHLLIPRLRLLQKKSTASSVVQRRELSHLLAEGRDASARIRVENVIATDIAVEVMEMVELYCELLLARANVLDQLAFTEKGVQARAHARDVALALKRETSPQPHPQPSQQKGKAAGSLFGRLNPFGSPASAPAQAATPTPEPGDVSAGAGISGEESAYLDPALDEAAAAIFYAWSRFPHDVRELTILRGLLADRYGKDFMALAQDNRFAEGDGLRVPERLVKGLRVRPPAPELVDSYLREIARAYGVSWGESTEDAELGEAPEFKDEDVDVGGGADGDGDLPVTPRKGSMSDPAELNRATPPRGLQPGKSPVSVAPPGPRSDNPNPRVKVPGAGSSGEERAHETQPPSKPKGGIPEVDELTRRFAALRK